MELTVAMTLYGTDAPIPERRLLSAGLVTAILEEGNLRDIRFDQIEMIRGIGYLIRDRDWGTLVPQITDMRIEESGDHFSVTYHAIYHSNDARLDVDVNIEAGNNRLVFSAAATPTGSFETNRAGFTILHPIGVSGSRVTVEHSDGQVIEDHFPNEIEPWQPFKNIQCLTHETSGVTVSCRLKGDVFEMEDQRNWSDASFKTYVRPLELPWPYLLDHGVTVSQSVYLSFTGRSIKVETSAGQISVATGEILDCSFPETALVLTPNEADEALQYLPLLATISPSRITCHFDPAAGHTIDDLRAFSQLQRKYPAVYDFEYAADCTGDLRKEFQLLKKGLNQAQLKLDSLLVCPSVDRQSTPPGSEWPDCPPLDAIYAATRENFDGIKIGGGMLSYFTELNRKRPPTENLDFISHGTNPIVHAADDQSVMQTLETIPYILKSTRKFAGSLSYRLGLSSIAMRQNPYGTKTMDNFRDQRICMANSDPRHWARFGAAFAVGYAAEIVPFGIESWTPAAFTGPRGVVTKAGKLSPLGHAISLLARRGGAPVRSSRVSHPDKLSVIAFTDCIAVANLTSETITCQIDALKPISLDPFAVKLV
ncbi:hypothetical protein GQF03_02255 [Sneathiella chungangensis]|uniref:Uncharacterized protein n=1 Tax=Sneathiella chungangensis TaxID=1418234 RepID=A0A845MD72_9PROT|nr:hypothetical protein [Sneathiella chungangensis]MZR21147.1 hypothetical protein [Sneathiella chungangensis]